MEVEVEKTLTKVEFYFFFLFCRDGYLNALYDVGNIIVIRLYIFLLTVITITDVTVVYYIDCSLHLLAIVVLQFFIVTAGEQCTLMILNTLMSIFSQGNIKSINE